MMRLATLSEKTQLILLSPIIIPIGIVAAMCILPAVPIILGVQKVQAIHRAYWIPKNWHGWFAWRPVFVPDDRHSLIGKYVWLERIERLRLEHGWSYRSIASVTGAEDR